MSFPEWGHSYNALCVPLTSDWQCALVPARDVEEPTKWWSLSYDERQRKRKERDEQIEQDRRDFDRLFRVSINRRAARACSDFSAYAAFISEHLRISGLSAPVDGDSVTSILRDAVRGGALTPAIDRTWRICRKRRRNLSATTFKSHGYPLRVARRINRPRIHRESNNGAYMMGTVTRPLILISVMTTASAPLMHITGIMA